MRKPATINHSMAQESVLLVGGCHGTCLLRDSHDEGRARGHRQLLLANAIVLTVSLAIMALLGAIVWS